MKERNYPIILGTKRNGLPTKVGLGIKSKLGSGYDFMILGLNDDHPDVNTCTKKELGNASDDGGASEEAMIYYNINCPYFDGNSRCHCSHTISPTREVCSACKTEWLDSEEDV